MQSICTKNADMIYTDEAVFKEVPNKAFLLHLKSDFAPDTLRSYNYVCHLTVFSRELHEQVGNYNQGFDGSQDFDMVLRLSEQAQTIVHIPKILYYWRSHQQSVASGVGAKPYAVTAAKRALSEHLQRVGLEGTIEDSYIPSLYKINYKIKDRSLVSIIIPSKDHIKDLDNCLQSILQKTTYPNYEILIVENNSEDPATFKYYDSLSSPQTTENTSMPSQQSAQHSKDSSPIIKIISYQDEFNYSAVNNFAAQQAKGKYLLFLNNDTEVITPDWIEEMLMFAQRSDVGVVGSMLYFPDDTIQHAGIILGIAGFAGHAHRGFKRNSGGYLGKLAIAQNLTAVTGACMMMRKELFDYINGFDEKFAISLNDIDLCLRVRKLGLLNVFTPFAELYHYESKSRGYETTPDKQARQEQEIKKFQDRWQTELQNGDPYYNPNLTLERQDFSVADDFGYY
jgi:GT2 family glycosyltransferase